MMKKMKEKTVNLKFIKEISGILEHLVEALNTNLQIKEEILNRKAIKPKPIEENEQDEEIEPAPKVLEIAGIQRLSSKPKNRL